MRVLAYGRPHASEERPATTRWVYGLRLALRGFDGTISYAYQTSYSWDDWHLGPQSRYRPNVMAYPTAGKPIPTLQWEAWREGVDDLRYLATYMGCAGIEDAGGLPATIRTAMASKSAAAARRAIIGELMSCAQ